MHFRNFLTIFFGKFRKFSGVRGAQPPDPPRGRPQKVFPLTKILDTPMVSHFIEFHITQKCRVDKFWFLDLLVIPLQFLLRFEKVRNFGSVRSQKIFVAVTNPARR